MTTIQLINPEKETGTKKDLLAEIQKAFGATPNMFKAIANSEAALESMWGSFKALGKGTISAKLGEQIAVAIADQNSCEYCLAAHSALGVGAGLSLETLALAQIGISEDAKTRAALEFAIKLVQKKGKVNQQDISEIKGSGFSDEEIVEILAHVALNIFTNYTNIAFNVEVDFPKIKLSK